MRSFVGRLLVVAIACAVAVPSVADAQRRRSRRGAPSGQRAPSAATDAATEADPALDAEARGLFVAGREAFDAGRYDSALDHFTRAYALSGRPGLLFNIASTAERLRRDQEALRAYESYLEAMPDAPNRDYTESRIVFLREQLRGEQARQASVTTTPPPPRPEAGPPAPERTTVETRVELESHQDDLAALESPAMPMDDRVEPSRGGDVTGEWWFWTLIGVAVVGAGAGITAGVIASQDGPSAPVQGDFGPGGVIVALERF